MEVDITDFRVYAERLTCLCNDENAERFLHHLSAPFYIYYC